LLGDLLFTSREKMGVADPGGQIDAMQRADLAKPVDKAPWLSHRIR
jgi:hypothetical protein